MPGINQRPYTGRFDFRPGLQPALDGLTVIVGHGATAEGNDEASGDPAAQRQPAWLDDLGEQAVHEGDLFIWRARPEISLEPEAPFLELAEAELFAQSAAVVFVE